MGADPSVPVPWEQADLAVPWKLSNTRKPQLPACGVGNTQVNGPRNWNSGEMGLMRMLFGNSSVVTTA